MLFLIFSIICSVIVSILLKYARQNHMGLNQIVAINYIVAALLSIFFLKPDFSHIHTALSHIWLFGLLGILLPSVFIIMGHAAETSGIVKADAAQRLSLFISVFSAFAFLGETLTTQRLWALILAFIALFCLLFKSQTQTSKKPTYWLLGVWLGYGSIDVLLKILSKTNSTAINLTIIFVLATISMFAWLYHKGLTLKRYDWIGGILLGSLNFCNIWFYIQAHRAFAQNPTLVFAGMNMGVIVLATLIGAIWLREKINHINALGIFLALLALYCLYS